MKNNQIICFIPARGGSKSIPLKNIIKLRNKELIKYTIDQALKIKIFDKIIVSTDSSKIIKKISNYTSFTNFQIIKRPKKFSLDNSSTEEALKHSLEYLKKKNNYIPTHIIILEPTSPVRKIISIKKFINAVIRKKNYKSFISVVNLSSDPLLINSEGHLNFLRKNQPRRRQLREKIYIEGSGMYGFTYSNFILSSQIIMKPVFPHIISKIESIDINDYEDLFIAKAILKKSMK